MNQSVAPTSFITSTSRRREYSESRIVLAISRIEAITSRIVSTAAVIVTRLVTWRIFLVSLRLLETFCTDGSIVRAVGGVSASRIDSTYCGLVGITWKLSGSGLVPSSL